MPSPIWHLDAARAHLNLADLAAQVDAAQPARGLGSLVVCGVKWDGARLLGLSSQAISSAAARLVEWHIRANDLIAVYECGPPHSARIDLAWRAAAAAEGEPWFASIDFLVSVRTDRLDWQHDITIESDQSDWGAKCSVNEAGFSTFHCGRWTYAEFVHPADLRSEQPVEQTAGHLRRRLFSTELLEKGVILRARARGLFMPPDTAAGAVISCYDNFVAADPPLDI